MLTIPDLVQGIKEELGDGAVQVELKPQHYRRAIRSAVRLLNQYVPREAKTTLVGAASTQRRYVISHPGLIDVVDLQAVRTDIPVYGEAENPFHLASSIRFPGTPTSAQYAFELMNREQEREVYSAEVEWEARWEQNETTGDLEYAIYLYLPENVPWAVGYTYMVNYTPDDDIQTGVGRVPAPLEDWVEQYTLARAKMILGRIRDKFKGIPSPDGVDMQVDGADLIAEAREDIRELREELRNRRKQIPVMLD